MSFVGLWVVRVVMGSYSCAQLGVMLVVLAAEDVHEDRAAVALLRHWAHTTVRVAGLPLLCSSKEISGWVRAFEPVGLCVCICVFMGG